MRMNMDLDEHEKEPEGRIASQDEVRQGITNLNDHDYKKLMIIARLFAKERIRGNVEEPGDLLHNAIIKTLDGTRKWNMSVSFLKHLDRVMESDSGHVAEKQQRSRQAPQSELEREDHTMSLDDQLAVREGAKQLLELFDGDKSALEVLQLKSEGCSAAEIRDRLGIDKREYETITKRIRRAVLKAFY